jgi:lysophospholipase L1-like esterase
MEDAMSAERSRIDRRTFLKACPALGAALALPAGFGHAALPAGEPWCATWGTAPAGPPPAATTMSFSNQTLRLIVHASIGGSRLRVRLSNEMGSTALRIGAAHIGLRSSGASLVAGSGRELRFAGRSGALIPAGAALLSDPVELSLPALADVAVSLYLPGTVQASTIHDLGLQTSYVSSTGNYASTPALPVSRSIASWPFLTEVDVGGPGAALVAIGDSLTDGVRSSGNANNRWPDYLARRLRNEALPGSLPVGIVNRGIAGNCMLSDYADALLAGRSGLERFDRDVLATSGARYLFVLFGINDICYSPSSNPIPADDITAGFQQLINRARVRGIGVLGATLPPFEGFVYYTPERETVRQRVNAWVRTAGAFDAVVDIEAVLRDPARPARVRAEYDSGDHLHPNDAGYQAMAQALPLRELVG